MIYPAVKRGFTLIELMVTVAIAATLMLLATPSFTEFLRNNELRSVSNGIYGALMTARSEAMARDARVYVIPYSDDDWNKGWKIFVDVDRDGTLGNGDVLINQSSDIPTNIGITGIGDALAATSPYVMYDGSGFSKQNSNSFVNGTFTVKRKDNDSFSQIRRLKVERTGKVRVCTPSGSSDTACSASGSDT